MNIPVINAVTSVFKQIFGVVDQLVEDKDKKNELIYKLAELQNALHMEMMKMNTIPWVDATVKLMFAFRDIIIPMFRPIVAALMTGFAAYAETQNITLSPVVQAALAGAFPGWIYSRHVEKQKNK